ncbi:lactate utilization protein C 1 [Bacillus cereus BAG5X1-1]|uniref:Lactate utilization protein C n=1 Tax=Bacillus cereus BAG5X1-1 TaxID=1053189 RepID=J8AGU9_BACCE|nr:MULTISPECIES: lactate utilization protein C [Bacillus cereus group]EJQ42332.1 lactate utilization protein C 1 [Bacillus cereus BAG5X1-1]PGY17423.1 lactate utilization protein C [Bacillus cereus]QWI48388.1 lactate utilization protein C [Bacillus mycoides]
MAIQNREEFLLQLSEKLGRKRPEAVKKPKWSFSPQWNVFDGLAQDELVLKLIEHCEVIHTEVKRTTTENLVETLGSFIKEWNIKSVICSNDERFNEYGLTPCFSNEGTTHFRTWGLDHREEDIAFAKAADLGITFSDMTLAESGTVVLFNDGLKGRHVSLLPESYIAIVPKSTIVPRLTHATKLIHDQNKAGENLPACVNFVSGPSNSADIEMNLVVGVHGPIRTAYIIVDDQ